MRTYAFILLACCIFAADVCNAADGPADKQFPGLPFHPSVRGKPEELVLSDFNVTFGAEEDLAAALAGKDPDDRVAAATALWRGRSLRHAAAVLRFLSGPPVGGDAFAALQRDVEDALRPESILRELKGGDYEWGAWLAFLRPHPDLVPTLVERLNGKKDHVPVTAIALGNSRDGRALTSLIHLLDSKDTWAATSAARALGYFGGPNVEQPLIDALAKENVLRRAEACMSLAKVGTRRAVPALERLANDRRFFGAIDVSGAAEHAIEEIKKREAKAKPGPL